MLKAKGNEILDAETGRQMAVILPSNASKADARRWAQYVVDRVNADERGKTLAQHGSPHELLKLLREIEPKMRAEARGIWAEAVRLAIRRIEGVQSHQL